MLTFSELKDKSSALCQRTGATDFKSQLGDYINLLLENLYYSLDTSLELKAFKEFTSVDGTFKYYMPSDFEKPIKLHDITNDKTIYPELLEVYYEDNQASVNDADESDADTYMMREVVGVSVQVATTGDTVKAKSSSTSDNTAAGIKVRVEGYLDSSLTILGSETITVNGTTAVAGTTTFYKITHYSKNNNSTGYISLTNSTGTTLAVLGDIERVARYKCLELRQVPDDSTTSYRMIYKKKFRRLVNDEDYPFIDADSYLIFGAVSLGIVRDKDNTERALYIDKERDKALQGILTNQFMMMPTDYRQKIESGILLAHRA